jgi:hypothetical protein
MTDTLTGKENRYQTKKRARLAGLLFLAMVVLFSEIFSVKGLSYQMTLI